MNIKVLGDADAVAQRAAPIITEEARVAITERGRFVMAVSGGHTPWVMLRALGTADISWPAVHHAPLHPEQIHEMPVQSPDLENSAAKYATTLRQIAGSPPVLDLVHLGLGPDGHTASLIPGDPVLNVKDVDVATTGAYQGRRRMTLTFPAINRARRILWVVTGGEKVPILNRLLEGAESIPANRICRERALLLADRAAAGNLVVERTTGA